MGEIYGLTINEIVKKIERGAAAPSDARIVFYPADLKTLHDYISKFTKSVGAEVHPVYVGNDPQPTYTVKLETNALSEIKAIVDGGATLVVERGGGLSGWTLKFIEPFAYELLSTSGKLTVHNFFDAYSHLSVNASGRQIYVDYPIPQNAGEKVDGSPKTSLGWAEEHLRVAGSELNDGDVMWRAVSAQQSALRSIVEHLKQQESIRDNHRDLTLKDADKMRDELLRIIEDAIRGSAE